MKIAIASQNRRTLTAHAGKCLHFFVVDTAAAGARESVCLSPGQSLHVWSGKGEHPLGGVDVVVAASLGQGVASKLQSRGIRALATSERDPESIIAGVLDGTLPLQAVRTEADARSRPGSCLASAATQSIISGNAWSGSH